MDKKASERSKISDFEIMNKLGQGSFGVVYKVKRKCNYLLFLIKLHRGSKDLRVKADRHV